MTDFVELNQLKRLSLNELSVTCFQMNGFKAG